MVTTTTYPRLEIDGKRYVCVPERVYEEQTTIHHKVSKETERRIAELRSGKAATVSLAELSRSMVGDDIKETRTRAGLSQAKLAQLAGVRIETISRIEQKKTTARPDTLDKLYKVIDRFSK